MNDITPTSAERAAKLEGMGCKRKRVEDIRLFRERAITSMTSSCPACSMAIWCAHHTAMLA